LGIKDDYKVLGIKREEARSWLLNKHYARRLCSVSFAFGLYDKDNVLSGVITFGVPGGNTSSQKTFLPYDLLELNRLIVDEGLKRNVLSFFVANALKLLLKPMIVVSYADSTVHHHGYIYQATNWIYTGTTGIDIEMRKGDKIYHRKAFYDKYGSGSRKAARDLGYDCIEQGHKYRYFMLMGSKKDKKGMMDILTNAYKIHPYPKGDNVRYDTGEEVTKQGILFS
jgi:hypothetical protein